MLTDPLHPAAAAAPQPPAGRVVVAVDVGGTTTKGAVVEASGTVLAGLTVPTGRGGTDPASGVVGLVSELLARAAASGRSAGALGVSSPGTVDAERGVVDFAANLGWRGLPLVRLLEERFGLPARLEHDARAGLLAELAARRDRRTARPPADLAFVPVGTGVSAALASGGAVLTGAAGAAGELGHVVVEPGGEPCACGQRGCVEVYASAAGVARRYAARGGARSSRAEDVVALVGRDPRAAEVWSEAVEALARALAALTAVIDPRTVVIGGGLALAGRALSDPLRERLAEALPWREPPQVDLSRVGPSAGLVGAALLALDGAPVALDFTRHMPAGLAEVQQSLIGGRS